MCAGCVFCSAGKKTEKSPLKLNTSISLQSIPVEHDTEKTLWLPHGRVFVFVDCFCCRKKNSYRIISKNIKVSQYYDDSSKMKQ